MKKVLLTVALCLLATQTFAETSMSRKEIVDELNSIMSKRGIHLSGSLRDVSNLSKRLNEIKQIASQMPPSDNDMFIPRCEEAASYTQSHWIQMRGKSQADIEAIYKDWHKITDDRLKACLTGKLK